MPFDWEQFYKKKAAELILYGRALGLGHGEAEDVLHETFIALMQLDRLPQKPEHYCLRTFRNRALNYKRSLWRRLTREFEALGNGNHWFERPSEENEGALQTAAIQCLKEIPLEQREVIVLKIWHHYTFDEIGALLGLSPNTVAGRYRYGLQKIKRQLETEEHRTSNIEQPTTNELPYCQTTGCSMFSQDMPTR